MGIGIDKVEFSAQDFDGFSASLEENLNALYQLLQRPGFGQGSGSIGAELEMYLVDQEGFPLYANQEILEDAADPSLTLELNRYNLEFNLPPFGLAERPFELRTNDDSRFMRAKAGGGSPPSPSAAF